MLLTVSSQITPDIFLAVLSQIKISGVICDDTARNLPGVISDDTARNMTGVICDDS
jgi:hypothetical protein